jgi:hypothetical protein
LKVFDKLIKVSKASFNEKYFNIKKEDLEKELIEKGLAGEELEKELSRLLPTEEEQDFSEVFNSNIAGLARLQRKMRVCLIAEVIDLEEDRVKYTYAGNTYEIREPKNAFRICTELEKSSLNAFVEVCKQKCFSENDKIVEDVKKDGAIPIDALRLAQTVCDQFFFQTFIV